LSEGGKGAPGVPQPAKKNAAASAAPNRLHADLWIGVIAPTSLLEARRVDTPWRSRRPSGEG